MWGRSIAGRGPLRNSVRPRLLRPRPCRNLTADARMLNPKHEMPDSINEWDSAPLGHAPLATMDSEPLRNSGA